MRGDSNELTRRPPEFNSTLSFTGRVHIGARALHVLTFIWFGNYRTPIPVGRRGVISSFKWFLPALATCRGRGWSAPWGAATHIVIMTTFGLASAFIWYFLGSCTSGRTVTWESSAVDAPSPASDMSSSTSRRPRRRSQRSEMSTRKRTIPSPYEIQPQLMQRSVDSREMENIST